MSPFQFVGLWMTIVGTGLQAAVIAHDGSPISESHAWLFIGFVALTCFGGWIGTCGDSFKTPVKDH
jgi:hypothetical protein